MNIIPECLGNIERTVTHLRLGQFGDAAQAVIACPAWFVAMLAKDMGAEEGCVPDAISGVRCVMAAVQEPFVVAASGRLFPVVPGWARAACLARSA
jgi:hypothetical protein